MGQVSTLTIGTNTFSVYALTADPLGDANKYFAASINAAEWTAASNDNRKKALVTAFRGFERSEWSGEKVNPAQATQFPRTGATCNGAVVPDGVPDDLVLGEFELALALLKDGSALDKSSTRSDVKSVKAGSAAVEFFRAPTGEATRFPLTVHELVGCMLAGSSTTADIPFVSGTDQPNFFSPDDARRTEGFA